MINVMRYTLFFSYQSDTKDEKSFILSALDYSKKILEKKDIELNVDHGMKGVPGNPNLLDTMLAKGSDCDIFLADLTCVAEFTNSSGHKKCVPNPNVMLELGHTWHSHGDNHTIFIQNKAKGGPEFLPVDLKGFRFPVSYTLYGTETKGDRQKLRRELGDNLVEAIKAVISSIEIQKEIKYLPFEKFVFWKSRRFNQEFIKTDYFNSISVEIVKRIDQKQNVIISGKEGCGKSRIINEIIKRQYDAQRFNDIFYCTMSQTNVSDLCMKLKKLRVEQNRPSIFIIDNCSDDIYKQINEEILNESKHQCICIGNTSNDRNNIKIDHKKYINEIVALTYPRNNKIIIDKFGYSLSQIICEINGNSYDPTKYKGLNENEIRIIERLSLFSKIGYENYFRKEYEDFCSLFRLNPDDFECIIESLIIRDYIIKKGGFIFVEADSVAKEYSKTLWENRLTEKLKFENLVDKGNLSEWFINRQVLVKDVSGECANYLKDIIQNDLRQISFLDTQQGNHITYKLAKIFPKEVLTSLEFVDRDNAGHIYIEIYSIIGAIKIITDTKALFDRAISLLLKLSDRSKQKVNTRKIIVELFRAGNNSNANVESLNKIYTTGDVDLINEIYSNLFKIGYKDLPKEQRAYLRDAFLFLISIREHNKNWANNLILEKISAARYLGLAKETFASIRTIAYENDTDFVVAEKLTKQIPWASADDKKSIKRLLKDISEKSGRNMLYQNVILYESNRLLNWEELKAAMKTVAAGLLSKYIDWINCIDVMLKGGRQYDFNAFWFGIAIGQLYKDCDKLIDHCLNLYNTIPQYEQSYDFVAGLFYKFVEGEDFSVFKQKRDEMLQNEYLVYLGLAMSNKCANSIADLSKIKEALIRHSLSIDNLNKLNLIQLAEQEYTSFSIDLINYNREASDTGIKLLNRALGEFQNINLTECLCTAITRYNYWDAEDSKYEFAYSDLIEMIIKTLEAFPSREFAESIISSMIKNCNSRNFNHNSSIVDLFKVLVEKYQDILLEEIDELLNDSSLENSLISGNYWRMKKLLDLFSFGCGNEQRCMEWCSKSKNKVKAAEFVAEFIPLFKYNDANTIEKWTDEALSLMIQYCENSDVLSIISSRLFNGLVSVSKYKRLIQAYSLLSNNPNPNIRLWAIEQAERLENCIKREKDDVQLRGVWDK